MDPRHRAKPFLRSLTWTIGLLVFGNIGEGVFAEATLPIVNDVPQQPLASATHRLLEALNFVALR